MDLISESQNHLLVITFPRTGSNFYSVVVELAEEASGYEETTVGNKPFHRVLFSKDPDQAKMALNILDYMQGWSGKRIYGRGRNILSFWDVYRMLECYIEACACKDYKAHCIEMTDGPDLRNEPDSDRYTFPCSRLHRTFHWHRDHPSSPQDQIQAAGIKTALDLCPFFDAKAFKKFSRDPFGNLE